MAPNNSAEHWVDTKKPHFFSYNNDKMCLDENQIKAKKTKKPFNVISPLHYKGHSWKGNEVHLKKKTSVSLLIIHQQMKMKILILN